GFDDEGISFPITDVPSEPARFRRLSWKFPSVGPDGAPGMRQFEELEHPVRQHDEFHPIVVGVQPARAHRIAINVRSAAEAGRVFIAKRFTVLVLVAYCRCLLLFPPFGHRRRSAGPAESVETPDTGKIVWIESMLLGLVLRIRVCTVPLVLTSRTSLPSRRRRDRRQRAITVDDPLAPTSDLPQKSRRRYRNNRYDDEFSHGVRSYQNPTGRKNWSC